MKEKYIEIHQLSLRRNDRAILNKLNLSITHGEILCLVGASGSGKSTLLRCLNRLSEPAPKTVFLEGQDIIDIDVMGLRRQVGTVFQQPILFPGTVAYNVAYGPQLLGQSLSATRIIELLSLASLGPEFSDRSISKLSGGEAQRVAIARVLANNPKVLLLDEPTSALDPSARRHIRQTVIKLCNNLGLTVLWVTHDMEEVEEVADRVCLLANGNIVDEGTPEHLLRANSKHLTAIFAAGGLD